MFLLEVVRQRILLAAGEGLDRLIGGKVVAALVDNAARVVRPESAAAMATRGSAISPWTSCCAGPPSTAW
jgi:ABC-type protease/lipase transport system fused ATPase/permease subunit